MQVEGEVALFAVRKTTEPVNVVQSFYEGSVGGHKIKLCYFKGVMVQWL